MDSALWLHTQWSSFSRVFPERVKISGVSNKKEAMLTNCFISGYLKSLAFMSILEGNRLCEHSKIPGERDGFLDLLEKQSVSKEKEE